MTDLGASSDEDRAGRASPEPASSLGHSATIPCAVPHLEIRKDDKGEFDEICAAFADGAVHVEMMDDNSCYVGFYWDDGRYCQWWFGARGKLWNNVEEGAGEPPRYTAQGVDTKPHLPDYGALAAQGIEARQRHDREAGHGPKDESPVAESDAPKG